MTIERWFKQGARFKWTAPKTQSCVQDGTIVDSPVLTSALVFDGADARLVTKIDHAGWAGFTVNTQIPHTWLAYMPGRTARVPLNIDVLTGFMSGCYIIQWTEGGQRYVGHLGTTSEAGKNQPPNSTVKQTFFNKVAQLSAAEKMQVSGYSPADAWGADVLPIMANFKSAGWQVVSLTTTAGEIYSIMMVATATPNVWVCGGMKKCAKMGYNALAVALA